MKNVIYTIVVIIVSVVVYFLLNPTVDFNTDDKEGIQFHRGNWQEALQLAKTENKLIFLDIYATWCGPCKKLKKNSFANAATGAFYNSHFINVTLNGEEGDGAALMEQYNLSAFPSLLFIDEQGYVIEQTTGYYKPAELLELGQKTFHRWQAN